MLYETYKPYENLGIRVMSSEPSLRWLLHVGVQEKNGEMKYRVVPHDIEDFEEILSRYGTHWAKPPDKGGGR